MNYAQAISDKHYQENIIVKILGQYFTVFTPDSGLAVNPIFGGTISQCTLNASNVDLRRVSTTISSYSIKLLDKWQCLSLLVQGDAQSLIGQQVEIWRGRVGVGMDFSNYSPLPLTRIKKIDYQDGAYTITTNEEIDRMQVPSFSTTTKLGVDILDNTTIIAAKTSLASFPVSGFITIEQEIIQYTGLDLTLNYFTGCTRGIYGTIPVAHSADTDLYLAAVIQDNPVNLILKLLTSKGGGSIYDVLQSGAGISQSLVDIAGMESIRDTLFPTVQFKAVFSNIDDTLKYIENEFLTPLRLRIVTDINAKITLKQIDSLTMVETGMTITDDSIKPTPKWSVDDTRLVNQLQIDWDLNPSTGQYLNSTLYADATSIATYGERSPLTFKFAAVRGTLNGKALVDDLAAKIFNRLSRPTPEITLSAHMDKSLIGTLDKVILDTHHIPTFDGSLNFNGELEVTSKGVNHNTGETTFKLSFTSGTTSRFCYLAPAETIASAASSTQVTLASGKGALYQPGWVVRLWDNLAREYTADPINTILSIAGDVITFASPWGTSITPNNFKLKFANYDQVADDQKRFCFFTQSGENFSDGKKGYAIAL